MKLEVFSLTEDARLEEVQSALLPTLQGQIGVLPGHTNLITVLKPGIIVYQANAASTGSASEKTIQVHQGGLAQITKDCITLALS